MMIYKSKNKLAEIINDEEKMFTLSSKVSVSGSPCKGLTTEINIEPASKNSIKKAVSILKKKKLYIGPLQGNVKEGYYCEITGNLYYVGLEEGIQRKIADSRFLRTIRQNDFFEDDLLLFRLDLGIGNEYRLVDIKCRAGSIQCFGEQTVKDYVLFSSNTSDPGILERQIPVNSLIRIENVDRNNKRIQGNPLYIKRKYE